MSAVTPNQLRTLLSPQHVCRDEAQHVCRDAQAPVAACHQLGSLIQRHALRQYLYFVVVQLVKCTVAACHEHVSLRLLQLLQHVSLVCTCRADDEGYVVSGDVLQQLQHEDAATAATPCVRRRVHCTSRHVSFNRYSLY